MDRVSEIRANLSAVRAHIEAAARACGRDPAEITLVAVSKTKPPEDVRAAYEAGQRDFGENYAQEYAQKRAALADLADLRWHFIGALQSNKAKVVAGCALVHAVDRASVAEALGKRAAAIGMVQEILVELNVGGESSKAGVEPGALVPLVSAIAAQPGLRLRGLMCIPPPIADDEAQRGFFRRLREARDVLRARDAAVELLSMGMSDDYRLAIAEGATHVRVGTAIFGARG